jgi:hypothetical protein
LLSAKAPCFSPPFAALLGLLSCGMVACLRSGRTPEVLTSDFCAAAYRGDLKAAGEAASEITAPLDDSMAPNPNATRLLADWLRGLPCVEKVSVSSVVILTLPGIKEVSFVLRAKDGDGPRRCDADLQLAAPWPVSVHPAIIDASHPANRCTLDEPVTPNTPSVPREGDRRGARARPGGMTWDEGPAGPATGGVVVKIGLSSSYAPALYSRSFRILTR